MTTVHLFLDWDGTLTHRDTLAVLAQVGYGINQKHDLRPWSDIVQAYLDDLDEYVQKCNSNNEESTSIADQTAFLRGKRGVEMMSIKRVGEAGIFRDVRCDDIEKAARKAIEDGEVKLRDGWASLFSGTPETRSKILSTIVSVNWSAYFIRSCLSLAAPESGLDARLFATLQILANELEELRGACTGEIGKYGFRQNICTSTDKEDAMREVMEARRAAAPPGTKHVIVYVGDSVTDFNALLFADVGICVRDQEWSSSQRELGEALTRVGVDIQPLEAAPRTLGKWPAEPKMTIYWAQDLAEVGCYVSTIT